MRWYYELNKNSELDWLHHFTFSAGGRLPWPAPSSWAAATLPTRQTDTCLLGQPGVAIRLDCTSSIWDVCGNILCHQKFASSSMLLKVLWYSFSICFFSGIIFPRFSNEVLAVILSLILQQIIPPDLTNKKELIVTLCLFFALLCLKDICWPLSLV